MSAVERPNFPSDRFDLAPLAPDGLKVCMLEPGGPCLAYAKKEGSSVAVGEVGFPHSDDVMVAWEKEIDGGIRRWEKQVVGSEIIVQVYRGVSSADSYGDGELVERYRCYQEHNPNVSEIPYWAMQVLVGIDKGATLYPYMNVPMRPLQSAQEAPQREVPSAPRGNRRVPAHKGAA